MVPGGPDSHAGKKKLHDLPLRFASAAVLSACALVAVFAGGQLFIVFAVIGAFAVFREWARIRVPEPGAAPGVAALLCLGFSAFFAGEGGSIMLLLGAVASLALLFAVARMDIPRFSWLALGLAYCLILILPVIHLRGMENGLLLIVLLLGIIWCTDIGAYFTGRFVGGPILWPRVSPKKTWSGAVGGLICAIVFALLVDNRFGSVFPGGTALTTVAAAGAVSAAGQIGDFAESALKRAHNIKDSGSLIPGHGGMMDRLDSLVLAAPVYWCFVYYKFV